MINLNDFEDTYTPIVKITNKTRKPLASSTYKRYDTSKERSIKFKRYIKSNNFN